MSTWKVYSNPNLATYERLWQYISVWNRYDIHVKSNQQGESNDTCFNWMRTCKANHKSKHVTYRRVAFVCVLTLFIFWHFNLNKLVE